MTIQTYGQVGLIRVDEENVVVKLTSLQADTGPGNGQFSISKSDPNFNAHYSLALSEAINRTTLYVLTTDDITSDGTGTVRALWCLY